MLTLVISLGCSGGAGIEPAQAGPEATPSGPAAARPAATSAQPGPAPAAPESCLGVADRGLWPDLDDQLQLALPAGIDAERVTLTVDTAHGVVVAAVDGWPVKPYPLGGDAELAVGEHRLALRPGDRDELLPLVAAQRITTGKAARDRDRDGIPDPLDVLIGAKKTVLNGAAYTEGYVSLRYPMGDVPRTIGVCTDVVVRALRNAGFDLQAELHRDLARARRAYPMVKGKGNASIDHRRVRTLLPFFRRRMERRSPALDDPADPLRPGDVVFLDTFPSRTGPDHIGIVSDRIGDSGLPLIINNWTNGTVTAEMDLLAWVPVTHRFRLP